MSIDLSPDGKFLAAGDDSANIILYNLETLKSVYSFQAIKVVKSITFSPDGKYLVAGTNYSYGDNSFVYNLETQKKIWTFQSETAYGAIAFSPDGKVLAVGSSVYDFYKQKRIKNYETRKLRK